MTDTPSPTPAPADAKPEKKKKPRRTWRQRFKLLLLVALIGLCLFRIALNVLLPTVIDKVAGLFGLEVGYQRLSLSLLGGTAHIWGLEVRPAEGGPSIAKCDYIQGNLAPLELLRARLVVYRAEVDGVDLTIERAADGSIPLLQKFASAQAKSAPAQQPATPGNSKPMSLDAPLQVDAIRLSHVTTTLRDKSVSPVFEATVRTNVRVSDVGLTDGPAKFELEVGVDPVLDTLRVVGEARTSPTSLKADVQVLLRGLHPKAAAGYLTPLGIRPVADYMTVQANASITAETQPNSPNIKASVLLDKISAITDGQEWASLASLKLDAKSISPTAIELGKLEISDGFASARRSADGHVGMAGLELAPAVAAQPAPPAAPATQPTAVVVSGAGPSLRVALDALELSRLQANIVDEAITPANALVARLESLSIKNIDTTSTSPVPISLTASVGQLIQKFAVDGQATLFAPTKDVSLAIRGQGIKPDLLRPYIEPLGLHSTLNDATASANVKASLKIDDTGAITANASASGVKFADGATSLIELNTAGISGLSFRPKDGSIAIQSIDLAGPTLAVAREADGAIAALGFRFLQPAAATPPVVATQQPVTTPATAPTATPAAPLSLPRIEIAQFNWSGLKLTLQDRAAVPAETFVIQDAGVELRDLLIDLAATNQQKPGTFRAHLKSPGLADELSAQGSFTPSPGRFTAEAAVNGTGLSGAPLANYLRPFGVEPTLSSGKLKARAIATLTQTSGQLSADLELADVTYADGDTELAGLDKLRVGSLSPKGNRIELSELTVIKPRAKIAREADGALVAGGIRLLAAKPTTRPAGQPIAMPVAVAPVTPDAHAKPAPMLAALPIELGIGKLTVENAALSIADAAAPNGPAQIDFVGGVTLDNLDVSPAAKPAKLHATASVDGALRQATVDGTLTASPTAPAIDLNVRAEGMAAGPLVSYLPPTIRSTLKDGSFATTFSASAANHAAGGLTTKMKVRDLKFADGETTLAKVGDFTLEAARLDPAAEVFSLAQITASGVSADVRQTPAGEIEAAGIRLVAAPPLPKPAEPQPAVASAPTTAPAEPVASVAQMVTEARRPLPSVSIDKLDLGVEHFGIAGFTGPNAAAVEVKNLHIVAPKPIALGGKRDPESPVDLNITGGILPIVGAFDVTVNTKPLANEPTLAIDVAASGIRGDGVLAVLPALKEKIDGSQLVDGQFKTRFETTLNYGRRGPRDLDIGRGFSAEFSVKPLEFRASPDGPVLAGVTEVHGEGIKVEPAKANVLIKSIDIATPIFHAFRDNDGIHAAGLVVKLAPQEPVESLAPASQPATQPAAETAIAAAPTTAPAPAIAQRPTNEIRLDQLTVSGIDCRIEDRTTKPSTIVPIKSLDVDVRDVSNQLPWNGKAVRFSVLMTSDKVPLPPRKGVSGTATTQQTDGVYTEDRELFSQITANGKVGFARSGDKVALDGWTKTAVNGFELLGVRGLAQTFGVTIGGGAFDDTNDVRFRPDGEIETRNKIVFTNLSLSEAADGPLQKILKLPAPIDVAIGAVTDPDGSITLNLPVPIKNGAVSAGDVVAPALGAVTNVLVTGIASAPLKAVSGVGGLLGLGGKEAAPEAPVIIGFLAAYDGLDAGSNAAIQRLVKELKDDDALELQMRHSLSEQDVARTNTRVNPPPEQALALAAQVRQQKAELVFKHDTLAAQARGDLGANAAAQAKSTLDALRIISQQIAKADNALDDLYALTGPSAAQQSDRRTRAASLDLARRRLEAIKTALASAGIANAEARVHANNPQFDPAPEAGGGSVSVTLVRKKH